MDALRGFAWLLACQSCGEAIARLVDAALPGPVIGMLLLLVALRWPEVQAPVGAAADALLAHLSLLFVPVGVGVMTHLALISQYGVRMLFTVVVSTIAGMAISAWVLQLALRRRAGHDGGAG